MILSKRLKESSNADFRVSFFTSIYINLSHTHITRKPLLFYLKVVEYQLFSKKLLKKELKFSYYMQYV